MTCVVGLETKYGVYLGGDSIGVMDDDSCKNIYGPPKVFIQHAPNLASPLLIGYVASWRLGQILQHHVNTETLTHLPEQEDLEFLVTGYIEAVVLAFEAKHYMKSDEGRDAGGLFLVGYKNRLYVVLDDFAIIHPSRGYETIAAGAQAALGTFRYITENEEIIEPRLTVLEALRSATAFSPHVSPPFNVIGTYGDDYEIEKKTYLR